MRGRVAAFGLFSLVVLMAVAISLETAEAQQAGKVPRVGLLTGTTSPESRLWGAVREQLREFGYVEGQNIVLEWRATGGRAERTPDIIAELVRLKIDIIVAIDNPSIVAAQRATSTIPIVMVPSTDPVGIGFVASLARPGGNITGLASMPTEVDGKALQLLKEMVPTASRVAVLWDRTEPTRRRRAQDAEAAALELGLQPQLLEARSATELDGVFAAMARGRMDAVLVLASQMIYAHRARIAELAAKRRLPTMCWRRETVEAGCLMGYTPSFIDLFRRAAYFVDKILKGAKPADLPVEQPTKFELVINLKTAKALGLTIPPSLLLRADRVIE